MLLTISGYNPDTKITYLSHNEPLASIWAGNFHWSDEHLHRFLIHGTAYGLPRLGGIRFRDDAQRVLLSRFRLHAGERFRYEYDSSGRSAAGPSAGAGLAL
jgi:hypothetical protein